MNDNFDNKDFEKGLNNSGDKPEDDLSFGDTPPQRDSQPHNPSGAGTNAHGQPRSEYQGVYKPYKPYGQNNGWQSGQWQQGSGYQNYNQQRQQAQQPYQFSSGEYDAAAGQQKGKKKNRGLAVFGVIIACVLAISVFSFAGYGVYTLIYDGAPNIEQGSQSIGGNVDPNMPSLNIKDLPGGDGSSAMSGVEGQLMTGAQVHKKVSPSIVGITVYYQTTGFSSPAIGSGIIMSADGYVITNAHVVNGGAGINVTLSNGEAYEARLVGMDTRTDLAVLKIEATNLAYAVFGNSDQAEVGDDVLAMGSPAGLDGSVSRGIISAKDREIQLGDGSYSIVCLQTDAAISPGISGGALVNMYGQVIGITSAKLVNEDIEGIGFAIPMNNAKPIVDDLIKNGRVTGRVRLGITAQAIDDATASYNRVVPGIRIVSTTPNSDISTKVRPGDIITEVGGIRVKSLDDMARALDGKKPQEEVELKVYRPATQKSKASEYTIMVRVIEAVD